MFQTVKLSNLRNSEFVQFGNDFTSIIEENNSVQNEFEPAFTHFKANHSNLAKVFNERQGSKITKRIAELDNRRGTAITGISLAIEAFTRYFKADKREAALLLTKSLKSYGSSIARLNYSAETSTLNDLTAKWKKQPELSEAVNKLGLMEWLLELEEANNLFSVLFISRIQDHASNSKVKIKDLRSQVAKDYSALIDHIKACTIVFGTEKYATLIKEINALIDQYDKVLYNRKSNSKETPQKPMEETKESID